VLTSLYDNLQKGRYHVRISAKRWVGQTLTNEERQHSGKYCYGKTPWQTFLDSKHLAQAKMLDELTATAPSDTARQRAEPEPERSHAERSGGGGEARLSAA